ncbi:hypothetical protein G6F56_014632 [Rhizopus delemar]|nr:hypothetical protein G6F56_014632 [Rhizopus delemar]
MPRCFRFLRRVIPPYHRTTAQFHLPLSSESYLSLVLPHGSLRCRLGLIWLKGAFVLVAQLLTKPSAFMS